MAKTEYNSKQFQVYLDPEKAWELIEYKSMGYDRDIDELYPDDFITERNAVVYNNTISKILLENEEYVLFEGTMEGYALTSFGRIINCKLNNPVAIYFTSKALSVSIRGIKIDFAAEFAKRNWPYDIDVIRRTYNENNWEIRDKNNNQNPKICRNKKK